VKIDSRSGEVTFVLERGDNGDCYVNVLCDGVEIYYDSLLLSDLIALVHGFCRCRSCAHYEGPRDADPTERSYRCFLHHEEKLPDHGCVNWARREE